MSAGAQNRNIESLLAGGFTLSGTWRLNPSAIGQVHLEGEAPREPGVYAHVVNGVVHYVGSAQRGLRKRLRHYQITQNLRTAYRVRGQIILALTDGMRVETFTLVPKPNPLVWQDLPVDLVAGLEEGLIRSLRPLWNVRGLGKIRDRDVDAADERE